MNRKQTPAAKAHRVADMPVVSCQWPRQRKDDFGEGAPRYDIVIVDEAHRARLSEVTNANCRRPNQYSDHRRRRPP